MGALPARPNGSRRSCGARLAAAYDPGSAVTLHDRLSREVFQLDGTGSGIQMNWDPAIYAWSGAQTLDPDPTRGFRIGAASRVPTADTA